MAEALKKLLKDEIQLTTVTDKAFADADLDKSGYV